MLKAFGGKDKSFIHRSVKKVTAVLIPLRFGSNEPKIRDSKGVNVKRSSVF